MHCNAYTCVIADTCAEGLARIRRVRRSRSKRTRTESENGRQNEASLARNISLISGREESCVVSGSWLVLEKRKQSDVGCAENQCSERFGFRFAFLFARSIWTAV